MIMQKHRNRRFSRLILLHHGKFMFSRPQKYLFPEYSISWPFSPSVPSLNRSTAESSENFRNCPMVRRVGGTVLKPPLEKKKTPVSKTPAWRKCVYLSLTQNLLIIFQDRIFILSNFFQKINITT